MELCNYIVAVIAYFAIGVWSARIAYRNPNRAQSDKDLPKDVIRISNDEMACYCLLVWPIVLLVYLVYFLVVLSKYAVVFPVALFKGLVYACKWAITVNNEREKQDFFELQDVNLWLRPEEEKNLRNM